MRYTEILQMVNSDPSIALNEKIEYIGGVIPRGKELIETKGSSPTCTSTGASSSKKTEEYLLLSVEGDLVLLGVDAFATANAKGQTAVQGGSNSRANVTNNLSVYADGVLISSGNVTAIAQGNTSNTNPTSTQSKKIVTVDTEKLYSTNQCYNMPIIAKKIEIKSMAEYVFSTTNSDLKSSGSVGASIAYISRN